MTAAEVEMFESNPHHLAAVKARHYDDDGKVTGLDIRPIKDYRSLLESLLRP
jgi:predicted HD phosphohydrolase